MAFELGSQRGGRRHRRLVVLLSMTALLLCADTVLGQATDAERTFARARMSEGRARRDAKDIRGALESFRAADALLHFPTTGLEVARAEADLGLLLQARETLRRVLAAPELPSDLAQFKKARAQSVALLAELDVSIPRLTIVVKGVPPGTALALVVDGSTMAPGAVVAPLRMNPGHHLVVATAGSRTAEVEIDLEARDAKEITISLPPRTDAPSTIIAPPGSAHVASPRGAARAAVAPPQKDRTLVFVGFGVAGLGATVGAIAGLSSLSYTTSAAAGCSGGRCPPSTHDDLRTAHTLATVSNVFLVVGAVGVGVGIFGLFQKPKAAPTTAVTPWIGPGSMGLRGTF